MQGHELCVCEGHHFCLNFANARTLSGVDDDPPFINSCQLFSTSITVPGSGEANTGVWPVGVFALPTTRHRPDGAHTAPNRTIGQKQEKVAIQGKAPSG